MASLEQAEIERRVLQVVTTPPQIQDDFTEHERTYRRFVLGVTLFAGHILAILLILGWVFSGSFG